MNDAASTIQKHISYPVWSLMIENQDIISINKLIVPIQNQIASLIEKRNMVSGLTKELYQFLQAIDFASPK